MEPVVSNTASSDEHRVSRSVAVIGTGYVGLVAAACLVDFHHNVACVDVDQNRIDMLRRGNVPFFEPGLEALVSNGVESRRLTFTTDLDNAVSGANIIFVTVGTPSRQDGSADLSAVFKVAASVARAADVSATMVIKSTVPVGTTNSVKEHIARIVPDPINVIVNPEFLREGRAVEDFFYPDRVVIGADEPDASEPLRQLYASVVGERPILVMNCRSAEMVKYVSNCFLATKLSFINEMANICDAVNADVEVVRHAVGLDPRIGTAYMAPGIGYGGSCLPKDLQAIENFATAHGARLELLPAVQRVNAQQAGRLIEQVLHHFGGDLEGRRVAVWGLAFKPNTDDVREAPALAIIKRLMEMGASVSAFDPKAEANTSAILGGDVEYNDDKYHALDGADALIVATEWEEFRSADIARMRGMMSSPVVFDGRNIFDPEVMRNLGVQYYCIGRSVCPEVPSEVAMGHD